MGKKKLLDHSIQQPLLTTIHQHSKAICPELHQDTSNKYPRYCDCGHWNLTLWASPPRRCDRGPPLSKWSSRRNSSAQESHHPYGEPASKIDCNRASTAAPTIIRRELQIYSLIEISMKRTNTTHCRYLRQRERCYTYRPCLVKSNLKQDANHLNILRRSYKRHDLIARAINPIECCYKGFFSLACL